MSDTDSTARLPRLPSDDDSSQGISDGALRGMFGAARANPNAWLPPPVEDLQKALPQYEVKAFVARGGMGAVYRGLHRALEREVAIKIMPPNIEQDDLQFAERFKAEAKAMARLEHPNIVAVHDAGETPAGLLYFVMEFVRGTDVQEIIAKDGKVEPRRALEITCAVLDALSFAHEGGIIHRDIKPSNVMFDTKGRVKVADFGLAKSLTSESAGFTGSEVMLGTADFIAPEAAIKGIKLDARADIYAVGVMLYVMLTGQVPRGRFEMPTAVLPKIDPRLDAIVDRAMQTDRERRYATAAEMKAAVEKIIAETCTGAMPKPGIGTPKSRSLLPTGVAAAAIVAAAAFFVFKKPTPFPKPDTIPATAAAKPTNPTSAPQEKWINRLDEWFTQPNPGVSRLTKLPDGTARVEVKEGISILFRPARNVAVRATMREVRDWFTLQVRSGQFVGAHVEGYTAGLDNRGYSELAIIPPGKDERVLLVHTPLPGVETKASHTLEFRAVEDLLTVLVDGKKVTELHDSTFAMGRAALNAPIGSIIEKLEYLILDPPAEKSLASTASKPAPAPKPPPVPNEAWTDAIPELLKTNSNKVQQTPEGLRIVGGVGFGPAMRDAALRVTLPRIRSTVGISVRSTGKKVGDKFEQYTAHFFMPGSVGLTRYGQKDAPDVQFAVAPLPGFDPNTKHTFELRAVGDRLTVLMDGKQLINQRDGTFSQGVFSISGNDNNNVFEKIEYAGLDRGTTTATAPQEKWVDRLAEWFTPDNANTSRLTRLPDGTARVESTNGTIVIGKPARDAAVRTVAHGFEKHFSLGLRGGKLVNGRLEGYAALIDARGYAELACFRPGTAEHDVVASTTVAGFDPGVNHKLEFRAVGDLLTFFVDEKKVIEQHDSTYTQGTSAFTTEPGTIIEKLDYMILDP